MPSGVAGLIASEPMRRILLFLVCPALMLCCNSRQEPPHSIFPSDCRLEEGDIVFRRGSGLTSRAVTTLEGDGIYSHVGIVVDSAGMMMIVHSVPGEPDFKGDEDRVKMDKPERFFSSVNAECGEVCRHADSVGAKRAAREAYRLYRKGVLFDHDYDDNDTTRLYCTELITYSFARAGIPFNNIAHDTVDIIMLHGACVLPSTLLEREELRSVRRF